MLIDAGRQLGRQQVRHRGSEEVQHGAVVEGRRVGHVDGGTCDSAGAGDGFDAAGGQDAGEWLADQFADGERVPLHQRHPDAGQYQLLDDTEIVDALHYSRLHAGRRRQ